MTYWSVLNTHPQAEAKAQLHCERQGFRCYAPTERVVAVRHGRKFELHRRLFPRYVFVWIDRRWHCLMSTFGVARVLLEGEEPGKLKQGWVEDLMSREVDGMVVLPKQTFRVGDPVVIEGGVFHGCRGLYQGQTAKQREVVLLESLGRVELAAGSLR